MTGLLGDGALGEFGLGEGSPDVSWYAVVMTATASMASAALHAGTALAGAVMVATAAMPTAIINNGTIFTGQPMTATASLPSAALHAGTAITGQLMTANASMPTAELNGGILFVAQAMAATASMPDATMPFGQQLSALPMVAVGRMPTASLQPAPSIGDPRDIQVQVYPSGLDIITLDRELQRPRWGSVAPGGDKQVTWARLDYPPYDHLYDPNTPVSLVDANGEFFCALVEDPGADFAPLASMMEYLALGYANTAGDQVFSDSLIFDATEQPLTVFAAALGLCPLIQNDLRYVEYIGRNFAGPTRDYQGSTPQDLMNAMVRYGNSANQPLLWLIRAAPVQPLPPFNFPNRAYLQVVTRPLVGSLPGLYVDLEDLDREPIKVPRSAIFNRVTIRYRDGTTTAKVTVDDTTSQATLGFGVASRGIRELYEDQTSRFDNVIDAGSYASTKLAELSPVRAVGQGMSITWPKLIRDEFGLPVAGWRTTHLVGQIIRVNNLSLGVSTDQLVVGADYDDATRQTTLATDRIQSLSELWDVEHKAITNEVTQQLQAHSEAATTTATALNPTSTVPDPHGNQYLNKDNQDTPSNPPKLDNDTKVQNTVIRDEIKASIANAAMGNIKSGSDPLQVGDGLIVEAPSATLERWTLACLPSGTITVEARTWPADTLIATGLVSGGITAEGDISPTVFATPIRVKFEITAADGVVTYVNLSLDGIKG